MSPTQVVRDTADVFGNGRFLLLVILLAAMVGITLLGGLGDVDGQSIVALYSAIIGGAVGHANGNLQGRLASEREHLLAERAAYRARAPEPEPEPGG